MENKFMKINSVSELHKLMDIPKPKNPLVSLINYSDVHLSEIENSGKVILNFYTVSIKHNSDCKFS
jgi:AraC family transcriptional activator of pobA